jgi:hypothetical protein
MLVLVTIFLEGKFSGTNPDFRIILCPLSPATKDAKPIPNPE